MKNYLMERRAELRGTIDPEAFSVLDTGFEFIEKRMSTFFEVTPEAVRKIELLECFLMSFVDHGMNFQLLDEMDVEVFRASRKEMVN